MEMVNEMKNTALRCRDENKYDRGKVYGHECELHEMKAFTLTHLGTDEDTEDTSSKTA